MKVLLIGGPSEAYESDAFEAEMAVIESVGRALGQELASRGHSLVLCSPFKESLDYCAALGATDGHRPTMEFHYPEIEVVNDELRELLGKIPQAKIHRFPTKPVGQEPGQEPGPNMLRYSWLFSQLNALDASAGVIAIGGRASGAAQLLFRLAAAKNKSVLPFTFLGGAAENYFDVYNWDLFDVLGSGIELLSDQSEIRRAPDLLEKLLAGVPHRQEDRFFISYARARPQEADFIETIIRRRNGTVYRDEESFEPAAEVQQEIIKNIRRSNVFIAVWCREYACSPWCADELEEAIERHSAGLTKLWIFCVDDTRMVPKAARDLVYFEIHERDALGDKIVSLMKDLQDGDSRFES